MKRMIGILTAAALVLPLTVLFAEEKSTDALIAEAVSPLPESMRAGASVVTYDASGNPKVLREGSSSIVCQPDQPKPNPGFSVSCYQKVLRQQRDMEAKMRAEGKEQKEIQAAVKAAREEGKLPSPPMGTMLYIRSGKTADETRTLWVMLVPNATAESTGLPTERGQGSPWLMAAGTPNAHVMIPQTASAPPSATK